MTSRLTDQTCRTATGNLRDGLIPGLELRVSTAGTKSWRFTFRVRGDKTLKNRSLSLGRYPTVTLSEARDLAKDAQKLAGNGKDPRHHRTEQVAQAELTVEGLVARYLETAPKANSNTPRTVGFKRDLLNNHVLPRWGRYSASEIAKPDVLQALDDLAGMPSVRRGFYAVARHVWQWALEHDLVPANPFASVRAPKSVASRDRFLMDVELRAIWKVEGLYADMSRLAVLTAQRRDAVATMRFTDLDLPNRRWTIPAASMKTKRSHLVPLSEPAVAILSRYQQWSKGPHVFGLRSAGRSGYSGFSRGQSNLLRDSSTKDWRFHDLRRTAVVLAQRAGAPLDAIKALTGHKVPGIAGVYAQYEYTTEKVDIVEAIAREIGKILVGAEPATEPPAKATTTASLIDLAAHRKARRRSAQSA